jgi:hypothetical protein
MRTRTLIALLAMAAVASGCDRSKHGGGHRKDEDRPARVDTAAARAADDTAEGDDGEAGDTRHRWQVKTRLAGDADPARATFVAIEDLLALPDAPGVAKNDPRYETARIPEPIGRGLREGQMVTTRGWLHLVAHPADDDYHLQLTASPTEGDHCLIVEIPDPDKSPDPRLRPLVAAARQWVRDQALHGEKPKQRGDELATPIQVTVTGALFYDDAHVGQKPRGKRGEHAARCGRSTR